MSASGQSALMTGAKVKRYKLQASAKAARLIAKDVIPIAFVEIAVAGGCTRLEQACYQASGSSSLGISTVPRESAVRAKLQCH
jgi:hypothetical protein